MTDERADVPGSEVPPPPQPTAPIPPPPAGPPPQYPYGAYPGGYPPPPPYGAYPPQQFQPLTGPKNGMGVAALVVAIIGLVLVWSVIGGLTLGVVAIVLGFIARGRCKRGEATNSGVATAGIVLGSVAVVLSLVFIGIWASLGARWFEDIGGRDYVSCIQEAGNDPAAQQECEETFQRRLEDEFGVTPTPTR